MTDSISVRTAPTLAMLREKRAEILAVAAQNKASNVRIFGSVARGDATPDSDVDFLVDFQPGASIFNLAELHTALADLLGVAVNVVSDHKQLRERFRRSVSEDVVIL